MKGKCSAHDLFCNHEGETELHFQLIDERRRSPIVFCSRKCADDFLQEESEGTWSLAHEMGTRGIKNLLTGEIETLPNGNY